MRRRRRSLRLFWRHRAAEAGDEGVLEELRTDDMEAIEAMIEALEGEESRKLIRLGMMLGQHRILGMGNVFEPAFGQRCLRRLWYELSLGDTYSRTLLS